MSGESRLLLSRPISRRVRPGLTWELLPAELVLIPLVTGELIASKCMYPVVVALKLSLIYVWSVQLSIPPRAIFPQPLANRQKLCRLHGPNS